MKGSAGARASAPSSWRRRRSALLVGAVLLCGGLGSLAQASPVGTIFAGAAAADPSAVYWNPAAMTLLQGTRALFFTGVYSTSVRYQRASPSLFDGSYYPEAQFTIASARPTFALVTDAGLRDWRFGLAFGIPTIDGVKWSYNAQGRPSSTRYHGLDPLLGEFLITAAAAYRVTPWLSLALGFDVAGALIRHRLIVDFGARTNQVICARLGAQTCPINAPFAREDPANDGRVNVDGFGWGLGLTAGVLLAPLPWLRLGVGVHQNAGEMQLPTDTSVKVPPAIASFVAQSLPGVALPPLRAHADLAVRMPVIVTAGLAILPLPRLELGVDLHWMDLSTTRTIIGIVRRSNTELIKDVVLTKGRTDYYLLALRGAYRLLPELTVGLRIEYGANTRPEEFVTPTSIDAHRIVLSAGVSWDVLRWLRLYGEFSHYVIASRDIRSSRFAPNPNPTTALEQSFDLPSPIGRYVPSAESIGFGVELSF
ncbi:MAG: outer membrane protein transport protein [Proteobacteria bacterium]|nr:outer membrane protein transport protein [Pseudomonadota bacterium]